MARAHRLALPWLLVSLAGCVNLAPRFERPAAPVRAGWLEGQPTPGPSAPARAGAAAPDLAWQDFITDARLRQVIAASLAHNRDLRVAALNIEQARALYRIERAAGLPQIDASGVASRQRTVGSAGSGDSGGGTRSQYTVQLGLASYEIDLFDRVGNLADSALASFFSVQENRHTVQIGLVAEVASAWLTLAADLDRLQLARDTLASQQASFDLTQRTRELGGTSGLAVARARTTVDAARVEVARYVTQVAQDRNALELLVGRPLEDAWWPARAVGAAPVASIVTGGAAPAAGKPPAAASAPAYDPPPASLLLDVPAGLPSEVLLRRPDVRAAEQLLRAANADIGAARAALYPRISLTAAAGTQSDSLSGLFKSGSGVFSVSPRIDLPLFDGGQRRANVAFSEAQQGIEIAQYERTLQTAFREVADTLALRETLAEQLAAQQSLIEANQRSLALSDALYRNGASSYLEVLDAQRSLYAAQQSLITLRLSEQANRIALYRSLGGGWNVAQAASN